MWKTYWKSLLGNREGHTGKWCCQVEETGLLLNGKEMFLNPGDLEEEAGEPRSEVVDEHDIKKILDGVATTGA